MNKGVNKGTQTSRNSNGSANEKTKRTWDEIESVFGVNQRSTKTRHRAEECRSSVEHKTEVGARYVPWLASVV